MYNYFGKYKTQSAHLAVYHCLDVVAVAKTYIESSVAIKTKLINVIRDKLPELGDDECIQVVLFLISIHDLGKFDCRFQAKNRVLCAQYFPDLDMDSVNSTEYLHGSAGWAMFYEELEEYGFEEEFFDVLKNGIVDVMGHHGSCNKSNPKNYHSGARTINGSSYYKRDLKARCEFVQSMTDLFLSEPILKVIEGSDCDAIEFGLLAGLCCISDWMGSDEDQFKYETTNIPLNEYLKLRLVDAKKVFTTSGIYRNSIASGFSELYPQYEPRNIQACIEDVPVTSGLTIVEAGTGEGKTEFGFSYASKLIKEGYAESIIFALPSQATANAMFERVEETAAKIFGESNVTLAHGKARFNKTLATYVGRAVQQSNDSLVQCSHWLSSSRKRTLLAQIGICTIDQVLMSVLAIHHQFVRGFGIKKSVLIIDEAHAYDAYMYGLLCEVLKECAATFSSVIIMSATLPVYQKRQLLECYGCKDALNEVDGYSEYPLITHTSCDGKLSPAITPLKADLNKKNIAIDIHECDQMLPDAPIIQKIIDRVNSGWRVAVICNTVAVAQETYDQLSLALGNKAELFHSRYTYNDRQQKEEIALDLYGKESRKTHGRVGSVLVATQVIEQSIDLDFDWMITQLCPIDLLFQRSGREGRHEHNDKNGHRPDGYNGNVLTVLVPPKTQLKDYLVNPISNPDCFFHPYGSSVYVYQNVRALYRTEQLVRKIKAFNFPEFFRIGVEECYQEAPLQDEDTRWQKVFADYEDQCLASRSVARYLSCSNAKPMSDTDENMKLMTREGDINKSALLLINGRTEFFDGTPYDKSAPGYWELVSLNSVMVTPKIERELDESLFDKDLSMYVLDMDQFSESVFTYNNEIFYCSNIGLR